MGTVPEFSLCLARAGTDMSHFGPLPLACWCPWGFPTSLHHSHGPAVADSHTELTQALHDNKEVNPKREYNICKYSCTQHRNT